MIIKTAGDDGSWKYFDGAREVQAFRVSTAEGTAKLQTDVLIAEREYHQDLMSKNVPHNNAAKVQFTDHTGPRQIYVNRTTYLLNDAGKTIERLF